MLGAPMNDQVKVILLILAQGLAHSMRLVGILCDVHLPAIWTEQVPYPPTSPMQMAVMIVVSRRRFSRCRSPIYEGLWCRSHCAWRELRLQLNMRPTYGSFYSRRDARAFRETLSLFQYQPVATAWLSVIDVRRFLIRHTLLALVNKHE